MIIITSSGFLKAQETGTFIDERDGHEYKWVKIGEQVWMAENLAYNTGNGCWSYNEDEGNVVTYGRLYNWESAKTACPASWHLPTDDEWKQLEFAIGMSQGEANNLYNRGTNEGNKLKATNNWRNNGNGTDVFGFSALPGGSRSSDGYFDFIGESGSWWSSTEQNNNRAWMRHIAQYNTTIFRNHTKKVLGKSVRCIKD